MYHYTTRFLIFVSILAHFLHIGISFYITIDERKGETRSKEREHEGQDYSVQVSHIRILYLNRRDPTVDKQMIKEKGGGNATLYAMQC